jgi:peptidoglycan/xylan/chitin deacetylase (PgdA/CDA1 family)
MVRSIIKNIGYQVIAKFGRQNWSTKKTKLLVVTYHRVLPRNYLALTTVQPGMYVFNDTFESHIKYLKNNYKIYNLVDWLNKLKAGEDLPGVSCAITFDDGWRDNYEYAYPILLAHKIPATIFLVANKIGEQTGFWPEKLANILWQYGEGIETNKWEHSLFDWMRDAVKDDYNSKMPTQENINIIIENVKNRYSDEYINQKLNDIDMELNIDLSSMQRDILNWTEIKEMFDSNLIDYGSHTLDHIRLNDSVNKETILKQVLNSKISIEKNLKSNVSIFCYPNGDYCEYSDMLVRENYNAALTTNKGWNTSKSDPYRIKRINLHEDCSNTNIRFRSKLSGWV